MLVLGFVVFAVAPGRAPAVAHEIGERFGRSLLTGFVLLVTVPAAAVLLLFTIVGIPLAATGILLYLATLYPAQVFVAAWLGFRTLGWAGRGREVTPSVYWSLMLGTIVLVALFAIPYVGWAIRLTAMLVVWGAMVNDLDGGDVPPGLITKVDLSAAADYDQALAHRCLEEVRPGLEIFHVSAKSGSGMQGWLRRLEAGLSAKAGGLFARQSRRPAALVDFARPLTPPQSTFVRAASI